MNNPLATQLRTILTELEANRPGRAASHIAELLNTFAEPQTVKVTPGASYAPNCPWWTTREVQAVERARQCSPDSEHTEALVRNDAGSRPLYAYVVEGEVSTGTLVDYAHAVETAYYSGFDVSDRVTLLSQDNGTVFGTLYRTENTIMGEGTDTEGYTSHRYFRLFIRDANDNDNGKIIDAADYRIDLRA